MGGCDGRKYRHSPLAATSHSRILSFHDPIARIVPSGENDTERTQDVCPSRATAFPVATSHSRILSFPDLEASIVPSGENDTERTQDVCPSRVAITSSVKFLSFSPDGTILASGSYDRTVRLWEVATGENIATLEGQFSPVATSHNLAVLSFDPEARIVPSGENDTERTDPPCLRVAIF